MVIPFPEGEALAVQPVWEAKVGPAERAMAVIKDAVAVLARVQVPRELMGKKVVTVSLVSSAQSPLNERSRLMQLNAYGSSRASN
jgi:hypothetical protein